MSEAGATRSNPVRAAAALAGLVVFLPVSMNYLALVLMVLAVALQAIRDPGGESGAAARCARARGHPMFWPLVAFAAWITLSLAFGARYPETASNAFHAYRIALTLALAISLASAELRAAFRGLLVGLAASALVVLLHQTVGLPDLKVGPGFSVWSDLRSVEGRIDGNKAIANALLFAIAGSCAFALMLEAKAPRAMARRLRPPASITLVRVVAACAFALAAAVVVWALPSRTALVILLCAAPAAVLHRWVVRPRRAIVLALAVVLVVAGAIAVIPASRDRFEQGWSEARAAIAGDEAPTSWGLRVNMYRHTLAMVTERPLAGWGVGSWNAQWRARAPASMAELNMPHNDFLWMGAQTGFVGVALITAVVLAAVRRAVLRRDLYGRLALVAVVAWLIAASANSAMRDAAIGLGLLWVVGLLTRLVTEPGPSLRAAAREPAPGRWTTREQTT